MAYNVFKRPMFKRGGSTTGTGIMSHVEPRVKAQGGAFTRSGNTLLFGRGQNLNDPLSIFGFNIPGTQISANQTPIPVRNFADDATFLLGPGKFLKAGGAGLQLLKQLPKYGKYSKFPPGYPTRLRFPGQPSQFLTPKDMAPIYTNRGVLERARPYASGAYEVGKEGVKAAGKGTYEFGKKYGIATGVGGGGAYGIYSLLNDPNVSETEKKALLQQANNAANNAVNKANTGDTKKDNTYKEADKRSRIQAEADEVMKVLRDPDMDKAQAALLISEALKKGGSLSDKIEYAVNKGKDIAAQKAKDRRAAKLIAYQAVSKRDEPTSTEKLVNQAAKLRSKKNLTTEEANRLSYLDEILTKEKTSEKLEQQYYFANRERISSLESNIVELQSKIKDPTQPEKYLDKDELESYKKDLTEYQYLKSIERSLGISGPTVKAAEGGRIGYADGTKPTPEGDVIATETAGEGNTVSMKPVEKLSFADLRNRLPKEITDDIVQLISSSEQALQDFAYIKTQQDVNNFNVKYGVNLILPPQKG